MEVKFIKPNQNLVDAIARDMRQEDVAEVWASNRHTPIEALMSSWKMSDHSVVITVNKEPCVMLGLVIRDILSGTGVPWLLGTNAALKHKRQFFNQVPPVINEMLNICPRLFNYVHIKNETSITWLKWIGFTVEAPEEYGPGKELFCKFHLERN